MRRKIFLASLKSMKKGVGSEVGSGSISQRFGYGDPDPHQNVKDPQRGLLANIKKTYPCLTERSRTINERK
jgi:hypothetical protein